MVAIVLAKVMGLVGAITSPLVDAMGVESVGGIAVSNDARLGAVAATC